MFLAADEALAGLIAVADPVKATTPEALSLLRRSGLRIIMATGRCGRHCTDDRPRDRHR
jgi:Cu+-exporting ATPase